MAINEPDYGGFGVFFNLKRNFELKKKGNIFEKSNEFFFIFFINFILQSLSASVNYIYNVLAY